MLPVLHNSLCGFGKDFAFCREEYTENQHRNHRPLDKFCTFFKRNGFHKCERFQRFNFGIDSCIKQVYTFVISVFNLRFQLNYIKQFISPNPIFLPINLIGEISKPVSLAFRLFGNMLGGVIILEFAYTLLPFLLRFIVPDILHAYFDLFAGTLQAFVFTVLSLTFIQIMAAPY